MSTDRQPGRFDLDGDAMRALGHSVVDAIIDHLETLPSQKITRRGERAELERTLREPIPTGPSDPLDVLREVREKVLPHRMTVDHPRFFGFVPGPGNFVGAMADALVAGINPFCGSWLGGSGPVQVELVLMDWLRDLCGLPESTAGLCVSGGSMANLTALVAARHAILDDRLDGAVAYFSNQTHFSIERALRVLGLRPDQLRTIGVDADYRLDATILADTIAADRAAGRRPFCVIANAGTTNTGAVDPMPDIAEICRREGMWMHVDGAYGAPAVICDRGRAALSGMDAADSLTLDPHKWLFQPFEIGCVLVRDGALLKETYQIVPEYMEDTDRRKEEVNPYNYGIQLTRSFRALKLWMSLKVFGLDAFRASIEEGIARAELAERFLRDRSGWQILTPARLGIITFRHTPDRLAHAAPAEVDAHNRALIDALYADGFAMISTTSLDGRPVLRLCTINPRTTDQDVTDTLEWLERHGA